FNNDNQSDIVVVNSRGKTISVLLGYGNGTFATDISKSTGKSSPVFIAMGDFNKDNKLDIAVAFQKDDNVGVFMGYGNGSFSEQIVYKLPNRSSPVWLIVHDFSKDNVQDMAVANFNENHVGILLGYGNGTFGDIIIYSTGTNSGPCAIAIGDFNNDNNIDIAVANLHRKTIGIMFGYGNGSFLLQVTYSVGSGALLKSIVVGDMNNDTILDIAASNCGDAKTNIGILYGLGNGTFLVPKLYSTGSNVIVTSIAIADFDNDGRNDVVASNANKNRICILLRDKTEPFGEQVTFSTGNNSNPYAVVVSDFNNDNKLDIAVANSQANNIGIFLGYGNGSFTLLKCYSTGLGSEPSFIVVGDLNKNNQTDLVVTNKG
ncbi:unnamed protein product, partial [Rotaria magnacalcarata]